MKKLIYLIVLTLILGLVLTGCLLSNVGQVPTSEQSDIAYLTKHTEGDPFVTDLIAGGGNPASAINVGDVLVWNDVDTLYVKYSITDTDWCLTETHLHVAISSGEIPQTKKGNPIPGQFDYSECYEPCVNEYTYEIELDWDACTELYIAAHAVVVQDGCYETVWQIGDVETNDCVGNLTNYANEFNWRKSNDGDITYDVLIGDCEQGPGLSFNEPVFTTPFIVGGLAPTPTEEFPYNSNSDSGYAINFDVQWNGNLPFGGLLTISWSPGASDNEIKEVRIDGDLVATLNATGTPSSGGDWFMNKYPLVEDSVAVGSLPKGEHIINFKQTAGDGTFWDWIRLEKVCEETAWGEGERFVEKGNWATYFTYTVQAECCPDPVINGDVEALSSLPTSVAKNTLTGTKAYVFKEFEGSVIDLPLDIGNSPYTGDICCYYVHLDIGTNIADEGRYIGLLTFDADVIGLIVAGSDYPGGGIFAGKNTLCETNSTLGAVGVDYDSGKCGTAGDHRGLEIGPNYTGSGTHDWIEVDDHTVDFSLRVSTGYHDAFRVIVLQSCVCP